ncbi:MAG: pyridoxamine 5'-phosphate oxidase family protein [Dehalococcoidia bacterium]
MADERAQIIRDAARLAAKEVGGTLATMHAEDGTPYVTYVFFHLRNDGDVVFASMAGPQHARNIDATPEVSFLIDNREVIPSDWKTFDRVVIEGRAERVPPDDPRYERFLEELGGKNELAARFSAERGDVYCIRPRRLILRSGTDPRVRLVDFEDR